MASCNDCIHNEVCDMPIITDGRKNASNCGKFKNKADFVEIPCRCKDCVLHEKGCPLDTHPYMTPDDGYCYQGGRK